MSLSRPLSPYRVLELGTGAGALCARVLADLGADVVKVEPVAGDAMRGQGPAIDGTGISFSWFNANKRWATKACSRRASMPSNVSARRFSSSLGPCRSMRSWRLATEMSCASVVRRPTGRNVRRAKECQIEQAGRVSSVPIFPFNSQRGVVALAVRAVAFRVATEILRLIK